MGIFIGLKQKTPNLYNEMEEAVDIFTSLVADCEAQAIAEFEKNASLELIGVENLMEIKNQLSNGNILSVETVFGPSLERVGVDLSDSTVAVESIMSKIKSGMHRVWEFIAKMVAWVKDFFAKRFGNFKGYAKSLKKRARDLTTTDCIVLTHNDSPNKLSKSTMTYSDIVTTIQGVTKSQFLLKYENIDANLTEDISRDGVPFSLTHDNDEDVITYEVEDKLDDMLDTDRDTTAVITGGTKIDGGSAVKFKSGDTYIKLMEEAASLASSLSNGKLYQAMQKATNKISQKIDKELKKASYSDDEKNNAKTMRNALSAQNKILKIMLKATAAAMASLEAPHTRKITSGKGGGPVTKDKFGKGEDIDNSKKGKALKSKLESINEGWEKYEKAKNNGSAREINTAKGAFTRRYNAYKTALDAYVEDNPDYKGIESRPATP